MNRREYDSLKCQAEEECRTAIKTAKATLKARLESIEWAFRSTNASATATASHTAQTKGKKHSLVEHVSQAIQRVGDTFDRSAVQRELINEGISMSRAVLSKTLERIAERGEIGIRERGRGRRGTVYQRNEQKDVVRT